MKDDLRSFVSPEPGLRAIQMLRAVLDGETYEAVSGRFGGGRTSVERRVKALAVQLTHQVGVEGLGEGGATFVRRLRVHRQAILAALERFEPVPAKPNRAARVLSAAEVEQGGRRVQRRSPRPLHDLALYHLLFATGLRPLEVARLDLADYLDPDGSVRRESRVRAEVAINGKERPLYFLHRRFDDAMGAYLDERLRAGHGLGSSSDWRGLDPRGRLFLGRSGEPYAITVNGVEGQNRFVCRGLLNVCRKMFGYADVPGFCAQSARLTLMSRMYERGADEEQVGLILGIADRSAVRDQLPRPRPALSKVLDELD